MVTDIQISSDQNSREDLNINAWEIFGQPGAFCSSTWSSIAGEGFPVSEDVIIGTSSSGVEGAPCGYYVTYSWIGDQGSVMFKLLTKDSTLTLFPLMTIFFMLFMLFKW